MRRPRALALLGAVAVAVAGCGDLFDFTASTSATDGAGTGTDAGSDTDTAGDASGPAEACGAPPAGPACVPTPGSALGLLCAARATAPECLAFGDGVASKCAWAEVTTYPAGALSCGGGVTRGACIGLQASAAPCGEFTCGGPVAATTYYRFDPQCGVEVLQGSYCGFEVVDWAICQWSAAPTEACATPWPSAGPPTCACAC